MSKVVKKIGKAIGKVVKGVVKGVKKVWKAVKQSKFLKIAAIAAAVYFGGAALMGGIGGMGAGAGGFMSGAQAGISSAWAGVTGSTTLASGFTGANAAGLATGSNALTPIAVTATKVAPTISAASAGTAAASTAGAGVSGAAGTGAAGSSLLQPIQVTATKVPASIGGAAGGSSTAASTAAASGAPITTATPAYVNPVTGAAGANTAGTQALGSPGLLSRAWNGLGDYGKFAAVNMVGQGLAGGLAAKAEDDAMRDAMARYGQNIGTVIPMPVYNPATGKYEYPNQSIGNADLVMGA
jgi:hypothetical protein